MFRFWHLLFSEYCAFSYWRCRLFCSPTHGLTLWYRTDPVNWTFNWCVSRNRAPERCISVCMWIVLNFCKRSFDNSMSRMFTSVFPCHSICSVCLLVVWYRPASAHLQVQRWLGQEYVFIRLVLETFILDVVACDLCESNIAISH